MTAEPIREPEADDPGASRAGAPPPEPAPTEPTPDARASGDAAIAEAQAVDTVPAAAPSAEVTNTLDASASEAAAATALDAGAPGMEAPAGTAPPADAPAATPAAPAAVADAPATPRPSRRPVALAFARRLLTVVLVVALFVTGVVLGNTTFLRTRPAPVGGGSIAITDPPPAVAQELIRALGANDSDAMRSSLPAQPNKDLTDEFTRFDIKKITSVETLGTSVDGSRSATEILLHAEKTNGLPFEVNLVILVDGGQIEGFR